MRPIVAAVLIALLPGAARATVVEEGEMRIDVPSGWTRNPRAEEGTRLQVAAQSGGERLTDLKVVAYGDGEEGDIQVTLTAMTVRDGVSAPDRAIEAYRRGLDKALSRGGTLGRWTPSRERARVEYTTEAESMRTRNVVLVDGKGRLRSYAARCDAADAEHACHPVLASFVVTIPEEACAPLHGGVVSPLGGGIVIALVVIALGVALWRRKKPR